jgi:hypothetical protein
LAAVKVVNTAAEPLYLEWQVDQVVVDLAVKDRLELTILVILANIQAVTEH